MDSVQKKAPVENVAPENPIVVERAEEEIVSVPVAGGEKPAVVAPAEKPSTAVAAEGTVESRAEVPAAPVPAAEVGIVTNEKPQPPAVSSGGETAAEFLDEKASLVQIQQVVGSGVREEEQAK